MSLRFLLTFVSSTLIALTSGAETKAPQESIYKSFLQGDVASAKKIMSKKDFKINSTDADGLTPLMNAALSGDLALVKLVLKKKPDLEFKNSDGETALAVALTNDQIDISKELIQAGAKVDILVAGDSKDTLLIQAAKNNLEITKLILAKSKLELNKTNSTGETPLMQAIRYGNNESAKFLIQSGADKTLKNKAGETALDIAKKSANPEAEKFLKKK
ncbi:hypothetical protein BDW_12820 [Bdellovibrio bacteriovorus W]|nr:hypothetical protein BDW_12820 [Bdellovibrio bacteriovorus W]